MKRLICFLIVLFVLTGCSYTPLFWVTRLNKDRKHVTQGFNLKKISLTTTDSTLIFKVDSTKFRPSTKTYHFDRNGKCDWIVTTFDCEKCYSLELTPIITTKFFRWVQPDSLTYVTKKFKAKLHKHYQNNPYSYFLKRIGN